MMDEGIIIVQQKIILLCDTAAVYKLMYVQYKFTVYIIYLIQYNEFETKS